MLLKITDPTYRTRRLGVLLADGKYEEVIDMDVITSWTDREEPRQARIALRTARRSAVIDADVITRAPLRNSRKLGESTVVSRIVEAFTRFEWDGVSGYGIAEYNDRLEADRPIGVPL